MIRVAINRATISAAEFLTVSDPATSQKSAPTIFSVVEAAVRRLRAW
jgi:hypothetical protein